jgi:hypothetical protein
MYSRNCWVGVNETPCLVLLHHPSSAHYLSLPCCRYQVREANPTLDANLVNTLMRTFPSLTPHFMVGLLAPQQ